MTKDNITLPLDTLQDLMIGYVRYCLPRHSYIISECVDHIKTYWDKLSENAQAVIKNDVESQVDAYENLMENSDLSDEIKVLWQGDMETWQELQAWLERH